MGKGWLDHQPCADSMLNTMHMSTQMLHVKCGWDMCMHVCVNTSKKSGQRAYSFVRLVFAFEWR